MVFQCVGGETAKAVATVTAGFVTSVVVTSGGIGYTAEPEVKITGGGGSGATARAILNGDKVSAIIVLTAGSGYTAIPTITIAEPSQSEPPPKPLNTRITLAQNFVAKVPPGFITTVESAENYSGPWTRWNEVLVRPGEIIVLDISSTNKNRVFRAFAEPRPTSPRDFVFGTPGRFVWIEPGVFLMGSPNHEIGRDPTEIQHAVTLTKGFWISDHEVTQREYYTVMWNNPSSTNEDQNPVDQVTWDDAISFCKKLTDRERAAGEITANQAYRLPTEAEWEYAARTGTDALTLDQSFSVEQILIEPNAWGLYQMTTSVSEWCSDRYGDYSSIGTVNPSGPNEGMYRVVRGGNFESYFYQRRPARRHKAVPTYRRKNLGFRVVLSDVE